MDVNSFGVPLAQQAALPRRRSCRSPYCRRLSRSWLWFVQSADVSGEAPEHHFVLSSGGIPKPVEPSHVAIEQVAIAAVEALDASGAAVSAAARIVVAGILPEPPTARCPGPRDLRRVMIVDDPKAAAREDRVGRDPAVGPGRMHVDERQPARGAGDRLHKSL